MRAHLEEPHGAHYQANGFSIAIAPVVLAEVTTVLSRLPRLVISVLVIWYNAPYDCKRKLIRSRVLASSILDITNSMSLTIEGFLLTT